MFVVISPKVAARWAKIWFSPFDSGSRPVINRDAPWAFEEEMGFVLLEVL